jgi:hypothetical protein
VTPSKRRPVFDEQSPWLDRFGLVLTLNVVSLVILSLVDVSDTDNGLVRQAVAVTANFLVAASLLLALRAAGLARRWQRVADVLVIVGIAAAALLLASGQLEQAARDNESAPPVLALVLALLAPVVIIRRLIRHRVVERGTLLGAVSAYLLIPVAFFYVFTTVDLLGSEPFFGVDKPTTDFMYFSLTTVTTVGYGDLTASEPIGRMLANAESLIGQLYLVTFVGLLVGLLTRSRGESSTQAETAGPPPQG